MIIFILFLFYWIGLSFRYAFIPIGIVAGFLSIIVFLKYKKKIFLISIALFGIGIGVSYIQFDRKSEEFSGMVVDAHENYFIMLSKGEKFYTYEKENPYEIGDYLTIKGRKQKLEFATLESQFDFGEYLNKKGVTYELKVDSIKVGFSNPIKIKKAREKFLSHFNDNERAMVGALLFSSREESSTLVSMNKLHILRLASASGIFIYVYLKLISFIIRFVTKKDDRSIIPIIILIPYFIITFPRFTVMRIMALEIMRYINDRVLKKRFSSLFLTGICGFLFLIIDYHLAYETSFIMGFSLPVVASFIGDAVHTRKKIRKRMLQTFLIYVATIPFELQFYNGINPLSVLITTFLSPLFIFTAVISLICLYGIPIYSVVGFSIKIIDKILEFLSRFAFQINAPPMSGVFLIVFALILLAFLYYKNIQFIPFYRLSGILLSVVLALYCFPVFNLVTAEVNFINVGQGDSCLIRKGNTAVLIDTGGLKNVDLATETLIPFFQKRRLYDIDLVITTHDDFDHNGAYDSLKENFYVKRLVTDATEFPISVGGITLNNYNNHMSNSSSDNENSLVVGFTISHTSYLITGDATIKTEKDIMNEFDDVPCDILKAGHHGSSTSTSDEFVKYLAPREAVISCGVNNRYGHPKKSVLETLERNGVKIRRTDLEGTITYRHYIFM